MNKYQEALDILHGFANRNLIRETTCDYQRDKNNEYKIILQELVDRATPIKILKSVDENGEPCLPRNHGVCPICGFVVEHSDKYCHECGQRLEG